MSQRAGLVSRLPEMVELERLIESISKKAEVTSLGNVHVRDHSFPLYTIQFGPKDPTVPTVAYFGGVHGLERIGTQVLLSYLNTVNQLLEWDGTFQAMMEKTRLIFMPLVNPGGMFLQNRANPSGVDLMRNAPVHADKISPWVLYAGHRISNRMPWYRGPAGAPMEVESQALCDFVRREIFPSRVAITVDVHSGYGSLDRVWFPYARTKRPFPQVAEVFAIKNLLDRTYPNHVYVMEPQSREYMTHGDLWDYLYDEYRKTQDGIFIPFSLELGSWLWIKKNVRQIFSLAGAFNPLIPHRLQRTLRRHLLLFDFLHRVVQAPQTWAQVEKDGREALRRRSLELWYG